jgi:hypothetical protein
VHPARPPLATACTAHWSVPALGRYAGNWRKTWHVVDAKAKDKLRKLKTLEGPFVTENATMLWGSQPELCSQLEEYFVGNMAFFPHFRPIVPIIEALKTVRAPRASPACEPRVRAPTCEPPRARNAIPSVSCHPGDPEASVRLSFALVPPFPFLPPPPSSIPSSLCHPQWVQARGWAAHDDCAYLFNECFVNAVFGWSLGTGDFIKGGYFDALTTTCGFARGECYVVVFEPQGLLDHTAEWHVVRYAAALPRRPDTDPPCHGAALTQPRPATTLPCHCAAAPYRHARYCI